MVAGVLGSEVMPLFTASNFILVHNQKIKILFIFGSPYFGESGLFAEEIVKRNSIYIDIFDAIEV